MLSMMAVRMWSVTLICLMLSGTLMVVARQLNLDTRELMHHCCLCRLSWTGLTGFNSTDYSWINLTGMITL